MIQQNLENVGDSFTKSSSLIQIGSLPLLKIIITSTTTKRQDPNEVTTSFHSEQLGERPK